MRSLCQQSSVYRRLASAILASALAMPPSLPAADPPQTPATTSPPPTFDAAATLQIVEFMTHKSDCLTCHQPDRVLIGPSFVEISKKYAGDKTRAKIISDSIRLGSSEKWGPIPMAPHPDLAAEDIDRLTAWILSLARDGYTDVDSPLIY